VAAHALSIRIRSVYERYYAIGLILYASLPGAISGEERLCAGVVEVYYETIGPYDRVHPIARHSGQGRHAVKEERQNLVLGLWIAPQQSDNHRQDDPRQ